MSDERIRNIASDLKRTGVLAEILDDVRRSALEEAVTAVDEKATIEAVTIARAIDRISARIDAMAAPAKRPPNHRIA